jgi:hypothetical protein
MTRFPHALALGSALVAGICLVACKANCAAEDNNEPNRMEGLRKAILKVAKQMEAGKNVKALVVELNKEFDELDELMKAAYNPRTRQGIGFGPKGKVHGIEVQLQHMEKHEMSNEALNKQKVDLIKMGYINLAMAALTMDRYRPSPGPRLPRTERAWKQFTEDMKKASLELIAAIKAGKPDKVKRAAEKLNQSCFDCHK